MWFEFASSQIQGKRAAQEDSIEVLLPDAEQERAPGCAERLMVALADGMGGHVGGRIASGIVARRFLEACRDDGLTYEGMPQALANANASLKLATEKRPELDGMGSTLVAACISMDGIAWISIGDSGLFLVRDGRIERLNEDHSFGAYLDDQAAKGLIAPDLAASDRRRNQLFHALLGDPIDHYEHRLDPAALRVGDIIVFASDGLKTIEDEAVGSIVHTNRDLTALDLAAMLLQAVEAEDRPRQDNATVMVVRVRDGDMPDAPSISRIVGPFMPGPNQTAPEPVTSGMAAAARAAAASTGGDVLVGPVGDRISAGNGPIAAQAIDSAGGSSRRTAQLALAGMAVAAVAVVGLIAWLM